MYEALGAHVATVVFHGNVTVVFTVPGPLSAASCQLRIPFVDALKREEHAAAAAMFRVGGPRRGAEGAA